MRSFVGFSLDGTEVFHRTTLSRRHVRAVQRDGVLCVEAGDAFAWDVLVVDHASRIYESVLEQLIVHECPNQESSSLRFAVQHPEHGECFLRVLCHKDDYGASLVVFVLERNDVDFQRVRDTP